MREQPTRINSGSKRARVWVITAVILITALAAATFAASYQPPYKPSPFEPDAVAGKPEPPENFGYSEIDAAGRFTFGLAGVMYRQEDGSLRVYFSNPEESEAYLMCEIIDPKGATLYRSGLLRPGEYVVSLYPVTKPNHEAVNIEIKVYALDPEHYYSIGMVTLDNILQLY